MSCCGTNCCRCVLYTFSVEGCQPCLVRLLNGTSSTACSGQQSHNFGVMLCCNIRKEFYSAHYTQVTVMAAVAQVVTAGATTAAKTLAAILATTNHGATTVAVTTPARVTVTHQQPMLLLWNCPYSSLQETLQPLQETQPPHPATPCSQPLAAQQPPPTLSRHPPRPLLLLLLPLLHLLLQRLPPQALLLAAPQAGPATRVGASGGSRHCIVPYGGCCTAGHACSTQLA
jgi:hypothetical protein